MNLHYPSAEDFLAMGSEIFNRDPDTFRGDPALRRFMYAFGTEPSNCALLWKLISDVCQDQMASGARPVFLLWSLAFLKHGHSAKVMSFMLTNGASSPKSVLKWALHFIEAMSQIDHAKIVDISSAGNFALEAHNNRIRNFGLVQNQCLHNHQSSIQRAAALVVQLNIKEGILSLSKF